MHDTLRCPGCLAELALPSLPKGRRVQCPRCLHTVDPARPSSSALTARPTAATVVQESRADLDDDLPDDLRTLIRPDPLRGDWLSNIAILLLAVSVLSILVQVAAYQRLAQRSRVLEHDPAKVRQARAEAEAFEFGFRPIAQAMPILHRATFGLAVVAFLAWLFQASRNLTNLRTIGVSHRPAEAVIAFFVPIYQLYRPYVIVQEIWQASDPEAIASKFAWFDVPASATIRSWWALFLTGNVVSFMATMLMSSNSWNVVNSGAWLACLANALLALAGALLIVIVHRITSRQRERYDRLLPPAIR